MSFKNVEEEYCPREKLPLRGYAVITLVFNGLLLGAIRYGQRKKSFQLSETSIKDLVLMGLATHKLSRIITKDAATSFIRAPFTQYQESLGYGEVNEKPRETGDFQVIGELLSCN